MLKIYFQTGKGSLHPKSYTQNTAKKVMFKAGSPSKKQSRHSWYSTHSCETQRHRELYLSQHGQVLVLHNGSAVRS